MSVETVICLADQLVVKPLFTDSRFIPCNQEDRLALRIGELLEKAGQGRNFRPHVFLQRKELRLELIADLNNPAHPYNMICR